MRVIGSSNRLIYLNCFNILSSICLFTFLSNWFNLPFSPNIYWYEFIRKWDAVYVFFTNATIESLKKERKYKWYKTHFYVKFLAWIGLLELKHGLIHHWVNSDVLISMTFYGELQSNPDSIDLTCKSKFWIRESVIITSSHCTSYNSDYALMLYCRMQKPCIHLNRC